MDLGTVSGPKTQPRLMAIYCILTPDIAFYSSASLSDAVSRREAHKTEDV